MTDLSIIIPLRGFNFRPAGKAIVQALTIGTPLRLEPDPSNQYDPHAIKIMLDSEAVPAAAREELGELLPRAGSSIEEFLSVSAHHIGFVPQKNAATTSETVAKLLAQGDVELTAEYATDGQGYPSVKLTGRRRAE
jgi:hypothetical protein